MIITQEMAQTILMDYKLTDIFWTQAVHTTVHIQNIVMLRNNTDKTPYEQVAEKNIRVEYVGTKEQVADIFTKPLPQEAFEYLRQRLGVISTPKMNAF
jgi:hypothetical protein